MGRRRWLRCGFRPSRRKKLLLYFNNVTSLSPRIMRYIDSIKKKAQIVCLAEHKKCAREIPSSQSKFQAMGFKSWWTQAIETKGGVSGGTSIHAHDYFMIERVDWAKLSKGTYLPECPENWTAVIVHGYINFVVVAAYFQDGIGFTGRNLDMISSLQGWLVAVGLPWLIVADWNVPPEELAASGVIGRMGGVILAPTNCMATCHSGIGRVLDYAAASENLAKLLEVNADYLSPSTPHIGLQISIDLEAFDDKILMLSAPPIPKVPAMKKAQHRIDMKIPEDPGIAARRRRLPRKTSTDSRSAADRENHSSTPRSASGNVLSTAATETSGAHVVDSEASGCGEKSDSKTSCEDTFGLLAVSWPEAKARMTNLEGRAQRPDDPRVLPKALQNSLVRRSVAFALDPENATDLGCVYADIITTAEIFLASRDPRLASEPEKAVGRANGPRYVEKSVKRISKCQGSFTESGACAAANFWSRTSAHIKLFRKVRGKVSPDAIKQSGHIIENLMKSMNEYQISLNSSGDLEEIVNAKLWSSMISRISQAADSELELWGPQAAEIQGRVISNFAYDAKKQFVDWQKDQLLSHHLKGLYSWVRKANQSADTDLDLVHNGKVLVKNEEQCTQRAGLWSRLWSCSGPKEEEIDSDNAEIDEFSKELTREMKAVIAAARDEILPPIFLEQFHHALYTFPTDTGKGSDQTSPNFVKALPLEAKEELVALFNLIQEKVAWPWQWLHVVVALIPKSCGGDWPIGLLPFLMRLFFRIQRPKTRRWTQENHGAWDTAIPGNSALQAALRRALEIECAATSGESWALMLLDIEKFYDPIRSQCSSGWAWP